MEMGGAGHETSHEYAYFKFTDELREWTISVQGGLLVVGMNGLGGQVIRVPMVRGGPFIPDTDGPGGPIMGGPLVA